MTGRTEPAIVAIDGPAGVGKTALALRWAHDMASQYIDGQLYADLRAFAPESSQEEASVHGILEEFLTALGVAAVPATTEQRARLFRSLTANRRLLVVLDNVASLEEIAPLLPASPGCGVVVTSRRALTRLAGQLGATRVTVQPLTEPHAIDLVRNLIGAPRADTDIAAVTKLTHDCGRLPLVLHAAAEQIAVYPHRPVRGLAEELAEEVPRLNVGESVDLAAVFSWSYRDLEPGAARVFRLLGLHSGDHLSVAAIAALAGVSVPLASRLLHPLATVHLVTVDGSGMVHLLAPVHAYARELVAAEDNDNDRRAAAQRLVTWYIRTARAAYQAITGNAGAEGGPKDGWVPAVEGVCAQEFLSRGAAIAWCEAEHINISAVNMLASEYGPSRSADDLGATWANLRILLRLAMTSSDGAVGSDTGGERTTGPSGPQAAALETRDDNTGSTGHQLRGMRHGRHIDLRPSPATITPESETQAQGGPLRPNSRGDDTCDQRDDRSPDHGNETAGSGGRDEHTEVCLPACVGRAPCSCCRTANSPPGLRRDEPSDEGRGRWRCAEKGGDLVMSCQSGSTEGPAVAVCREGSQNTGGSRTVSAALRIPAPRA